MRREKWYFACIVLLMVLGAGAPSAQNQLDPLRKRTCHVAARGMLAYCATSSGLEVLDLNGERGARRLGGIALPQSSSHVCLAGKKAYVAQGPAGVYVIDISNGESPEIIYSIDTRGSAMMAAYRDGLLAVADGSMGVAVYDVKRRGEARLVATTILPGYVRGVAFAGATIIASAGSAGLYRLDPARALRTIDRCPTAGDARQAVLGEGYIYVADGARGLSTVALGESGLKLVSTGAVQDFAHGLTIDPPHLFTADGAAGVGVYSLADPARPRRLTQVPTGDGYADKVTLAGRLLLVANDWRGLMLIDVSRPEQPRPLP